MHPLDLIQANLLSPPILCFALGALARFVKSDLALPEPLFAGLSIYLMLAIGIRGGVELSETPLADVAAPALAALALGMAIPVWTFACLRWRDRFSIDDAAALAAHYGSVSAVTFAAIVSYLDAIKVSYEGFAPALLALMEIPAIVVAILLAKKGNLGGGATRAALTEIVSGKSVILLAGGLLIGLLSGPAGFAGVKIVFSDLFRGALCLFLLELGILAARYAHDFSRVGGVLISFAVVMPLLHGVLGIVLGKAAGLSPGGAAVLGTLAASASYIAAPAAVRVALPRANPGLYLTAALAITFPFNLSLGLPLYETLSRVITSPGG